MYALGTLLYEMLTGRLPFEPGSTTALLHAKLHGEPTPPSVHRPGLAPELEAIVMRAIAREPRYRYPGAGEMLAHLRAPAQALAPPPPAPRPRPWRQRRRRTLAALLVIGAVALGLVTLVLMS